MYQCAWDRFDIVAAHYCYAVQWHSGQFSPEYARQCRISGYASGLPDNPEALLEFSDNAALIYLNLIERNFGAHSAAYTQSLREYERNLEWNREVKPKPFDNGGNYAR